MKIAVLGGGNMGGSIAAGAVRSGFIKGDNVIVTYPTPSIAEGIEKEGLGIRFVDDNPKAVEGADVIIVAVKPWLMEQVLGEIAPVLDRARQCVASVAAGINFETLEKYLLADSLGKISLYRLIPNTAISLCKSVTFIACHNDNSEVTAELEKLFGALGSVFRIREEEVTAMTALSSSGIAYALRYLDAAAKGGMEMEIDKDRALRIIMDTMKGAIALLEKNGEDPQTEINKVTTPGGITLKGLDAMEKNGFTEAVINGLLATR